MHVSATWPSFRAGDVKLSDPTVLDPTSVSLVLTRIQKLNPGLAPDKVFGLQQALAAANATTLTSIASPNDSAADDAVGAMSVVSTDPLVDAVTSVVLAGLEATQAGVAGTDAPPPGMNTQEGSEWVVNRGNPCMKCSV